MSSPSSCILEHVRLPAALSRFAEDAVIRNVQVPMPDRIRALTTLDNKLGLMHPAEFGRVNAEDVEFYCSSF